MIRLQLLFVGLALIGCGENRTKGEVGPPQSVLPDVIEVEAGMLFRGTFSPDGSSFYYFVKVAQEGEDYRVFRTVRTASGWSPPVMLPLGDPDGSSMYPAVSPDGELLVFSSYRTGIGESENANLWITRRSGDGWEEPEPLLNASTPDQYDAGPWFGPDGSLRFTSTSPDWSETWMRKAPRDGDTFGAWEEDDLWDRLPWPRETHHFWNGVLNRAGTIAVLELSPREADGRPGNADLWVVRKSAGAWSPAERLGEGVNSAGTENFASFAPDDTTLIFVRDFSAFHAAALEP